jgi:hypothetical protein
MRQRVGAKRCEPLERIECGAALAHSRRAS